MGMIGFHVLTRKEFEEKVLGKSSEEEIIENTESVEEDNTSTEEV